jgi:hypothetical protein
MFNKAAFFTITIVCMANSIFAAETVEQEIVMDLRDKQPYVYEEMIIDTVWAAHPVGFFLMTHGNRQYAAYYNADRDMVVAMRNIGEQDWVKFKPQTDYKSAPSTDSPASSKLGWDSHNYIEMALDSQGFVHLSGNMHCNNLTYFRSTKPYDITTLEQMKSMTGEQEKKCTYPVFMKNPEGRLLFKYRTGTSGNGNEIYNIYDVSSKQWTRLIDKPLSDGKGQRNAYFQKPELGPDNMYHISWVWRETYDCSTNHDLSYAKSPDMVNWHTVSGEKIDLPITLESKGLIVDPVPVEGGIINGTGKIGFDNDGNAVLSYHKFDEEGNTQAYCARAINGKWQIKKLTDWDYRWYFEGGGSIVFEVRLGQVKPLNDKHLELSYNHSKYGSGTWLLDNNLNIRGKVLKGASRPAAMNEIKNDFEGMKIKLASDAAGSADGVNYYLKWETLGQNRDRPREGKLPGPSELILYGVKFK